MSPRAFSVGVLVLLALLLVSSGQRPVGPAGSFSVRGADAAGQPSLKAFIVMVTSNGFDAGTLNLTVTQGDTVQITFSLDASQLSDDSPDNHHVIEVSGYNVKSDDISPSHPNATITFVADTLGTFRILCLTSSCPIHYLMLSGAINVEAPSQTTTSSTTGSSTSTVSTSTTSTVSPSTSSHSGSGGTQSTTTSSTSGHIPARNVSNALGPGGLLGILALLAAAGFVVGTLVGSRFIIGR